MSRLNKLLLFAIVMAFACMTALVGDSMDINGKLIATTISVDRKDGEVWFYVEFANIEASAGSGGASGAASEFFLVKAHGKTFLEARLNLNRQLDKPLYMGSVRTLLITQRFAQSDLVEYLYRLRADEAYRKKIITITTRDDLDALFKTMNDQNRSVGHSVENTIKTLDNTGDCSLRTTSRLLENLSSSYTGILIPCIGLQDREVAFTGYTVVNDTKAIGFIPIENCVGLNMLKADKAKSFYIVAYQNQRFSIEVTLTKRKILSDYQDGRANFTFSLNFDATIEYGDRKTPYHLTKEKQQEIKGALEQMILQDLLTAFDQAQKEFQTDYLQCDDAFRVKNPILYESLNWTDTFVGANLTAKIDIDLVSKHMLDYGDRVER